MNLEKVLKEVNTELKALKATASAQTGSFINQKDFVKRAESISKQWFSEVKPSIDGYKLPCIDKYDKQFHKLLTLSGGNNRVDSYIKCFTEINSKYKTDLLIPIQTFKNDSDSIQYKELLDKVKQADENEYLVEAFGCLQKNFLRASIILGWCSCIDRIHRKLEEIGFDKFNQACVKISSQKQGRFKRFDKKIVVTSISELREVFDNDILWIIEGMELIDLNQHTRLRSCFDMRCHSAHPGEAPITKFNILSFFSDIIEIILNNKKFEVKVNGAQQSV